MTIFQTIKSWFVEPAAERVEPVIIPEVEPEEEIPEGTGNLTIKAITHDDQTGKVTVDMDWDSEFVEYLKRNGFTGASEETIVHKYVATLFQNMQARQHEEGKDYE